MEQLNLKVQIRKTLGNGPARVLRREGRMPAVLYGPKIEPVLLSLDIKEFELILKEASVGSVLLNLKIQVLLEFLYRIVELFKRVLNFIHVCKVMGERSCTHEIDCNFVRKLETLD